jgi:ADP-ribose pyrophosphatase
MKKDRSYRKSTVPENAKLVFEGKLFDTYQWVQTLYDGTTQIFEKVVRTDTTVIYPVLPDGKILLVEDSQPHRDSIITAPAGRLEDGETPQEAIERELLEETGYAAEHIEPFYTYQPYEKFDWVVHVFIGKGCKKVAEPKVDPGEQINLKPVTFDEMIQLAIGGTLHQQGFTQMVLQAVASPEKMEKLQQKFSA